MKTYSYTSNAWGYFHTSPPETLYAIIKRLGAIGFCGFDLLVGEDAFPKFTMAEAEEDAEGLHNAAMPIASIVLVSFGLENVEGCILDLRRAVQLACRLNVSHVHLLPRKIGISRKDGMTNLKKAWDESKHAVLESGVTISAENHVCDADPDRDIFLIRTEQDFHELVDLSDGQIRVKFDPAWLLKGGEEPLGALRRLLPYVEVLDVKDFGDGQFVTPGTGDVDFRAMAEMIKDSERIRSISVEVEAHHSMNPPLTDADKIDALHKSDLEFYKNVF